MEEKIQGGHRKIIEEVELWIKDVRVKNDYIISKA
jgi:hypothetical protein